MSIAEDLKTVLQLVGPTRGDTHQRRLENFYAGQAKHYDDFRRRLLHGRESLWQSIPIPDGGAWVDFGGGTGANLESIENQIDRLGCVRIVDLSTSLLAVARQRIAQKQWNHVVTCEADATTYTPPQPADVVTFSYSLTMIPDWYLAIDNAFRILRPGGIIAVVDFYVSRKYPANAFRRHASWTQWFWPTWFRRDNVYLSADHLPYLSSKFESTSIHESCGKLPYVPFARVPYYQFIGRKPVDSISADRNASAPSVDGTDQPLLSPLCGIAGEE